jgi:hypothetical protein
VVPVVETACSRARAWWTHLHCTVPDRAADRARWAFSKASGKTDVEPGSRCMPTWGAAPRVAPAAAAVEAGWVAGWVVAAGAVVALRMQRAWAARGTGGGWACCNWHRALAASSAPILRCMWAACDPRAGGAGEGGAGGGGGGGGSGGLQPREVRRGVRCQARHGVTEFAASSGNRWERR